MGRFRVLKKPKVKRFNNPGIVMGWDLSSKKLACVYSLNDAIGYESSLLPVHALKGGCSAAAQWVHELCVTLTDQHGPMMLTASAYVEAPIGAARLNIQVMLVQSLINGAVLSALQKWNIPTEHVAPASWKKTTVGKGNADKKAVAAWVLETNPEFHSAVGGDQDLLDAYCINRHGMGLERT